MNIVKIAEKLTSSHKNVTIRLIGQVPTVPINSIVKIIGGF